MSHGLNCKMRSHPIKSTMRPGRVLWVRPTLIGIVAIAFVSIVASLSIAKPSGTIPPYAVKIAGRHFDNTSWGIWLFGKKYGQNCWGTRTKSHREVTSESATCGVTVPSVVYQFAASGDVGTPRSPQSLLFFLVKPSVRRLDVLIRTRGAAIRHWISVKSKSTSTKERQGAHLSRKFGYVVMVIRRSRICVAGIKAFGAGGKRLAHGQLNACIG